MAKCTGMRCPMQVGYKVDECNYKECHYRTEPITNADKIRAMSDEELSTFMNCNGCPPNNEGCNDGQKCSVCWLEWLQKPAEEET